MNKRDAKRVPRALPTRRAIVLGRMGYDLYSDDIGAPLDNVRHFRAGLGGSTANIAVGLARLDWDVTMLGAVSDDAIGRFVVSRLADEGVNVDAVQIVRGRNTSLALTEVAPPSQPEQVFYRCEPADTAVVWDRRMAALFTRRKAPSVGPAIFVTNGTTLSSTGSRAVTTRALRAARALGMTTVLDVDYRASSWKSPTSAGAACRAVWPWVDIMLANESEMRLLAPRRKQSKGAEERVAVQALRRGVQIVVWKRGDAGSTAFTSMGSIAVPAVPTKVVSTNGAGDAFAVGFLTAYGNGLTLAECLTYGSATAAHVVARVDCAEAMPRFSELEPRFASFKPGPRV
jgi:5-dehydro-2-deoxygluconokinase